MDPLSRYQLSALRAVEAAGRLGSMAKAAEELGVTVGAVSQQVLPAEQRLGRPIFLRTPKGLRPTPLGEDLLAGLSRGFGELSQAVSAAQTRAEHGLTVTVAPVFAAKWLVPRLQRFHALRPDLQIRIDASVNLVDFRSSDIDVGIRVGPGPWPEVRAEHLVDQYLFPVCSPELSRSLKAIDDLKHCPVIRDHGSLCVWDVWLRAYGRSDMTLGPGPVFSDASLCLDAAVAGQGVMIAWPALAQDAMRGGRLVSPFPKPIPTGSAYWLVSPANRKPSANVKAFGDWVRSELTAASAEPMLDIDMAQRQGIGRD